MASDSAPGLLLTLEGIDGSGKTTQAERLVAALRRTGAEVVALREPGGTTISERIRALVLDPALDAMSAECELLLMEASRAQLVREVIEPSLARGAIVVCDRFLDSTYAYQHGGRGIEETLVQRANELGCCGVRPRRTVVFDLDPTAALMRTQDMEPDRLEAEGLAFQQRIREAYLRLAHRESARVRVIDAEGDVDEVFARLCACLADLVSLDGALVS
jgi:dTMP kinase